MLHIRQEQASDVTAIHQLNRLAFEEEDEANIVDALRNNCEEILSLVALKDEQLVGHILFSPVRIETDDTTLHGMGLAPMAVHPDHQHEGIGTQLITQGVELLQRQDTPFIIVLGHPNYYPRFGFQPASTFNIHCQWEGVPDEAFMALLLDKNLAGKCSGTAYYRKEFTIETD